MTRDVRRLGPRLLISDRTFVRGQLIVPADDVASVADDADIEREAPGLSAEHEGYVCLCVT
jgi:hypothetical protein